MIHRTMAAALARTLTRTLTAAATVGVIFAASLALAPAAQAATPSLPAGAPAIAAPAPTAPASAGTTVKPAPIRATRMPTVDVGLLALINTARTQAGLVPLRPSSDIQHLACTWTLAMVRGATDGQLAHNPDLSTMVRAMSKRPVRIYGENVAAFTYGSYTASQIFAMYMRSPGHRANIMNPKYRFVGIVTLTGPDRGTAFNTMNFIG